MTKKEDKEETMTIEELLYIHTSIMMTQSTKSHWNICKSKVLEKSSSDLNSIGPYSLPRSNTVTSFSLSLSPLSLFLFPKYLTTRCSSDNR